MTRCGLTCIAMLAGCALIVTPVFTGPVPRLVWNASASVPIGLYLARPVEPLSVGDLVAVPRPKIWSPSVPTAVPCRAACR